MLGEKRRYFVKRFRCCVCRKTFTLLKRFMLPFKHHAASEIEEALYSGKSCGTHADERTIGRWTKEFGALLPVLSALVENLAEAFFGSKSSLPAVPDSPLKRLCRATALLGKLPGESALALGMFIESRHRLCLGWQAFPL
ncbi:MAG: DUF6431 domain-containing protein [Synergistaceae bacterium]|nr:DUF6431 domain-containing protein [Synergistaceae bacterium]